VYIVFLIGKIYSSSKRTAATEGLIAMAYVNNILVAVFTEQFFGIQSAVLPALYNIPYYIGIIILKKLYSVLVCSLIAAK
jgi:bile acid:Na+ symporter, BASS family